MVENTSKSALKKYEFREKYERTEKLSQHSNSI